VVRSFVYVALKRLIELVLVGFRSDDAKEVEILVLRHELGILRREQPRPRLEPRDRVWLTLLSRLLPRHRRSVLVVTPAALLGWHRRMARRPWAYPTRRRATTVGRWRPSVDRAPGSRGPALGLPAHQRRARRVLATEPRPRRSAEPCTPTASARPDAGARRPGVRPSASRRRAPWPATCSPWAPCGPRPTTCCPSSRSSPGGPTSVALRPTRAGPGPPNRPGTRPPSWKRPGVPSVT
jgi:hypothetical protein